MKEVEILIEVNDTKEKALKALGVFQFQGTFQVLDVYFVSPFTSDLQPDDALRLKNSYRLRKKGEKSYLAYKVDHFINGNEWSHSDEYEIEISDFEAALQINQHLGFKELVRVDNIKHVFVTDQYEIVLEEVKDLGLFLEVEKRDQVSDQGVPRIKEEIRSFLKSLNLALGEEQNAGKPELLLRKKG